MQDLAAHRKTRGDRVRTRSSSVGRRVEHNVNDHCALMRPHPHQDLSACLPVRISAWHHQHARTHEQMNKRPPTSTGNGGVQLTRLSCTGMQSATRQRPRTTDDGDDNASLRRCSTSLTR